MGTRARGKWRVWMYGTLEGNLMTWGHSLSSPLPLTFLKCCSSASAHFAPWNHQGLSKGTFAGAREWGGRQIGIDTQRC